MKFELSKAGTFLIVRIGGELDHHYCDIIRNRIDPELMEPPIRNIVFDLTGLTFMDSSGLGLIMGRYALVKRYGGKMAVLDPSPAVQKMMNLAGMERMVPVRTSKKKG